MEKKKKIKKKNPMMIAFWTVNDFVKNGKEFTMEELENEVIKRGEIFRIAPNYPLRDFIKELVYDGILRRKGDKFVAIKGER